MGTVDIKSKQPYKVDDTTGGDPPDNGDMEKRLSNLEIRIDTVLPTLATKSDIADLKGSFHELKSSFSESHLTNLKFFITTAVSLVAVTITILTFVIKSASDEKAQVNSKELAAPAIIINVPSPAQTAAQPTAPQTDPQKIK